MITNGLRTAIYYILDAHNYPTDYINSVFSNRIKGVSVFVISRVFF